MKSQQTSSYERLLDFSQGGRIQVHVGNGLLYQLTSNGEPLLAGYGCEPFSEAIKDGTFRKSGMGHIDLHPNNPLFTQWLKHKISIDTHPARSNTLLFDPEKSLGSVSTTYGALKPRRHQKYKKYIKSARVNLLKVHVQIGH